MNLSTWLAKLTDITNLGKFLVDGGPGILLAAALLFLINGSPELPIDKRAKIDARSADIESKLDAQYEDPGFDEIHKKRLELQEEKAQLGREAAKLQKLQAKETKFKNAIKELEDAGRLVSPELIADREKAEKAVKAHKKIYNPKLIEVEKLEHYLEGEKLKTSELDGTLAKIKSVIKPLDGILTSSLSVLVVLVFAGWILGTLANPINRIAVLQLVPVKIGELRKEEAMKDVHVHGDEDVSGIAVSEDIWNLIKSEVAEHRPPFFMGRGLITAGEWENLVKSYYRWTEASMNLVLPAFAWTIALFVVSQKQNFLCLLIGPLLIFALIRMARRSYRTYKTQVAAFVAGKLVQLHLSQLPTPAKKLKKCEEDLESTEAELEKMKLDLKNATREACESKHFLEVSEYTVSSLTLLLGKVCCKFPKPPRNSETCEDDPIDPNGTEGQVPPAGGGTDSPPPKPPQSGDVDLPPTQESENTGKQREASSDTPDNPIKKEKP